MGSIIKDGLCLRGPGMKFLIKADIILSDYTYLEVQDYVHMKQNENVFLIP